MKIAILLTGQLRTIDLTKYIYMNNIISKYDTDVFISINIDNKSQNQYKNSINETIQDQIDDVLSFFNPVDYFIMNKYEKSKFNSNLTQIGQKKKILFEQYFIVNKAYEMLINHINKFNITYDLVIRLRFDQLIWTDETKLSIHNLFCREKNTILFNRNNIELINNYTKNAKIENNCIYVLGYGKFQNTNYNYVNDQFFYHDFSLINIMSKFYESMENLIIYMNNEKIGDRGAYIECMFDLFFKNNNVNLIKSRIKGIFIRENN
jgi:hypothetical protein